MAADRSHEDGGLKLLVVGPPGLRASVRAGVLAYAPAESVREADGPWELSESDLDSASAAVLCLGPCDGPGPGSGTGSGDSSEDGPEDDAESAAEELLLVRPDLPIVVWRAGSDAERQELVLGPGTQIDCLSSGAGGEEALAFALDKARAVSRLVRENARLSRQIAVLLAQVKAKNQQLEDAVQTLEQIAATDPLTGLANRRSFAASLERRFAEARRSGHELSLLAIDLDGFKELNDTLGHAAGDRMLMEASASLMACCRRSDVAARFGGDEFVVLLPDTDTGAAVAVAQRIAEVFAAAVSSAFAELGYGGVLTMSQGVGAVQGSQAMTPGQLLKAADQALYESKRGGKHRVSVHAGPDGVREASADEDGSLRWSG
ncbi:MAG: GGDEF domain-containing protein [Planctomycetota bacterium]